MAGGGADGVIDGRADTGGRPGAKAVGGLVAGGDGGLVVSSGRGACSCAGAGALAMSAAATIRPLAVRKANPRAIPHALAATPANPPVTDNLP